MSAAYCFSSCTRVTCRCVEVAVGTSVLKGLWPHTLLRASYWATKSKLLLRVLEARPCRAASETEVQGSVLVRARTQASCQDSCGSLSTTTICQLCSTIPLFRPAPNRRRQARQRQTHTRTHLVASASSCSSSCVLSASSANRRAPPSLELEKVVNTLNRWGPTQFCDDAFAK